MHVIDLTFKYIIEALAVLIVAWEIYKNLKAIKKESDDEHARREGWDYAAKVIKEKEKKWDEGLADVYEERGKIVERFDTKLAGLEDKFDTQINNLKDEVVLMQTNNEAKNQELKADIIVLIKGQKACLDGLVEQGCNGPVTIARDDLDEFLVNKV